MSVETHRPGCLDANMLAEYIDGGLEPTERARVETHLAECGECYEVVAEGIPFAHPSAPALVGSRVRRNLRPLVLIAASVALVVGSMAVYRWVRPSPVDAAVAAFRSDLGEHRIALGRVSDDLPWAALPPITRGETTGRLPLRAQASALRLQELLDHDHSGAALRAAALGFLTVGDVDRSIASLEEALTRPGLRREVVDAIRVDLSAALLERWRLNGTSRDAFAALSVLEEQTPAVPANDSLPARFNRALAFEATGQRDRAIAAWQFYLEGDASSGWATEAREHLAALSRQLAADASSSDRAATTLYYRLTYEWLPRWADDPSEANRQHLVAAMADGRRLGIDAQDLAVLAAVLSADEATARRLRQYLRAMDQWQRAYDEGEHERAQPFAATAQRLALTDDFLRVASGLASAQTEFSLGNVRAATALLDVIEPRATAYGFNRTLARIYQIRGIALLYQPAFSSAMAMYDRARAAAVAAKDLPVVAAMEALVGDALGTAGDDAGAWQHLANALGLLDCVRTHRGRYNVLATAGIAADVAGLHGVARQLASDLLESSAGWNRGTTLALLQRARASQGLQATDQAMADLAAARVAVESIGEQNARDQFLLEIEIAEGQTLVDADPARSNRALSSALIRLNGSANFYRSADLLLARSRTWRHLNNSAAAEADLRAGVALVEDERAEIRDAQIQISRTDHVWDLYADLLDAIRSDALGSLEVQERAHARELLASVADPAARQPVSGAALYDWMPPDAVALAYATLPDRLLIWQISRRGVAVREAAIGETDLKVLVADTRVPESADQAYARLGTLLIPADIPLSPAAPVALIPDGPLHGLAFSALRVGPTRTRLVEQTIPVIAPSLSVLRAISHRPATVGAARALLVGISGSRPAFRLPAIPGAETEVERIAPNYAVRDVLVGEHATKADVLAKLGGATIIHIATHAIADRNRPERSSLLVAPTSGTAGLTPGEIAETRLRPGATVLLAACQTAVGREFRGEGLISLVRPFLAAGAGHVIGSYWPIGDASSVTLIDALHSALAKDTPAAALAKVQRGFIAGRRPVDEWAAFAVFGGFGPQPKE